MPLKRKSIFYDFMPKLLQILCYFMTNLPEILHVFYDCHKILKTFNENFMIDDLNFSVSRNGELLSMAHSCHSKPRTMCL